MLRYWLLALIFGVENGQSSPCSKSDPIPFVFTALAGISRNYTDELARELSRKPCIAVAKTLSGFHQMIEAAKHLNSSAFGVVIEGGAPELSTFFSSDYMSDAVRLRLRAVVIQRESLFAALLGEPLPILLAQNRDISVQSVGEALASRVRRVEETDAKLCHILKANLFHHGPPSETKRRLLQRAPKKRPRHPSARKGNSNRHSASPRETSRMEQTHLSTHSPQSHRILMARFCDFFCNSSSTNRSVITSVPRAVLHFLGVSSGNEPRSLAAHSPADSCLSEPGDDNRPPPLALGALPTNLTKLQSWAASNFSWASRLQARRECDADDPSLPSFPPESRPNNDATGSAELAGASNEGDLKSLRYLGPRDTLSSLKLVAKVHEPFLAKGTLKKVNSMNPNDSNGIVELGTAVWNQLKRNTVGKHNEGMDRPETQALLFKRRSNPAASSFGLDETASSQFCADFSDDRNSTRAAPKEGREGQGLSSLPVAATSPSYSRKSLSTAVCLVGATRSFARYDVMQAFRYRFLAGWGIENARLFSVLVEEGHTSRQQAIEILAEHNIVGGEWYSDTPTHSAGGLTCEDGHEARQLKQWARCLSLIKEHENKTRTQFDAVVKIRPDDLWYGAMVPHCVLDLENAAYISRQQKRWSDQWFALPRRVAESFMDVVHTSMRPYCSPTSPGPAPKGRHPPPPPVSKIRRDNSPPFETMVFDALSAHAKRHRVNVFPTLLPRILSRERAFQPKGTATVAQEASDKCGRFLWFVPRADCVSAMLGDHPAQYPQPGYHF